MAESENRCVARLTPTESSSIDVLCLPCPWE